ncbi:hypothetical protein [Streptomyces aurantiogriseus]|uniref:Uncharacterized protein n=1 Tax=Streptomyces aurantiogriseus TaxID=66870 RepID=A0A918FNQ2_9ACTN|nr:hypothetical protein [Streptomyces aurantiogriseus]GGR61290.1 hypothetical protein GCM10010251_92570 [Streptomyces aurantiogriseus]
MSHQPIPRADAVQTAIAATQAYAAQPGEHAEQVLRTAVQTALHAGATPDDLRAALDAKQTRDRQATQG